MSTSQEVIDSAQALLGEIEALATKKAEKISQLRQERESIDKLLVAFGVGVIPDKKRKPVSAESRQRMSAAQLKRHGKGGTEPSTEQTN